MLPSLEDDLRGADSLEGDNGLEGDNIEERLRSALVDQHGAIPVCPREVSLYPPSEPLQELASQDDTSCYINRDVSGELSHPTFNILDEDDGREGLQQHQEPGEEEEQGECGSNSGSDGDSHDDDNDQDSDDSKGPRPTKRRRLSPLYSDPTSKRRRKRRLQRRHNSRSYTAPVQTQLKQSLSLSCGDRLRSEKSLNHSSSDDEEPTSNTTAEYQEWPMRGFFKRTMIDTPVWTSA